MWSMGFQIFRSFNVRKRQLPFLGPRDALVWPPPIHQIDVFHMRQSVRQAVALCDECMDFKKKRRRKEEEEEEEEEEITEAAKRHEK